jgi:hypothetical protein
VTDERLADLEANADDVVRGTKFGLSFAPSWAEPGITADEDPPIGARDGCDELAPVGRGPAAAPVPTSGGSSQTEAQCRYAERSIALTGRDAVQPV